VVEGPKLHCCPKSLKVPLKRDEMMMWSRWMRPLEGSVLKMSLARHDARTATISAINDGGECGNPSEPTIMIKSDWG